MSNVLRRAFGAGVFFVLAFAFNAVAHEYALGELKIVHPWGRATPPGATTAAAYLKFVNDGSKPFRFVSGSSPVAERVEVHTMTMDGGVMRMRPLGALDIPAGATVELKPGGMHLMLIGLKRPIMVEETIPVTLTFEGGATVTVDLSIEGMGASESHHGH